LVEELRQSGSFENILKVCMSNVLNYPCLEVPFPSNASLLFT
jgi:hypothetical protein